MQIGFSIFAVFVKKERLLLTVVVTPCQCREMEVKEEQRVTIQFCCKVDFSVTKTVELIQKAYGDAALSRTLIFDWPKRFGEGRESVKDDEFSGRPTTSRTDDNIAAVDKMVKERSKNDVSVNSRYARHPENCGSTDFKRRFEETKTVLNAPAHSAAIIREFLTQKQVATLNHPP